MSSVVARQTEWADGGGMNLQHLFAALMVIGLLASMRTSFGGGEPDDKKTPAKEQDKTSAGADEDPVENVNRAKEVLTSFFAATTVEEMAKYVRHPEKTLPRMKEHFKDQQVKPLRFDFRLNLNWSERDTREGTHVLAEVEVDGFNKSVELVASKEADLKLDWESLVGWCEMPWQKFLESGSPKAMEFRVQLSLPDYYNWDFSDSKKLLCFSARDADNTATVYCYCEADSETGRALLKSIREARRNGFVDAAGEGLSKYNVRLTMKEADVPRRQARIESMVRGDWSAP